MPSHQKLFKAWKTLHVIYAHYKIDRWKEEDNIPKTNCSVFELKSDELKISY